MAQHELQAFMSSKQLVAYLDSTVLNQHFSKSLKYSGKMTAFVEPTRRNGQDLY